MKVKILIILIIFGCSFNSAKIIEQEGDSTLRKRKNEDKNLFYGYSYKSSDKKSALKEAEYDALEKIYENLGVTVDLNSETIFFTQNDTIFSFKKKQLISKHGKYFLKFNKDKFYIEKVKSDNEEYFNAIVTIEFLKSDLMIFWEDFLASKIKIIEEEFNLFYRNKCFNSLLNAIVIQNEIKNKIPLGIFLQLGNRKNFSRIVDETDTEILAIENSFKIINNRIICRDIEFDRLIFIFESYEKEIFVNNNSIKFSLEDLNQLRKTALNIDLGGKIILKNIKVINKKYDFTINDDNFLAKKIKNLLIKRIEFNKDSKNKIHILLKSKILKEKKINFKSQFIADSHYKILLGKDLIYQVNFSEKFDTRGFGAKKKEALRSSENLENIANQENLIFEISEKILSEIKKRPENRPKLTE